MVNGIFRVMLAAVAVSVLAASVGFAADANAPAEKPALITVKGVVSVVKDANGVVTAVKLTTADKVVSNVIMDKVAMDMAKADGKEVEAQAMKHGADLMVVSFKVVEKAPEHPEHPKSEEKPKQ